MAEAITTVEACIDGMAVGGTVVCGMVVAGMVAVTSITADIAGSR
jgi:hypothetical protein